MKQAVVFALPGTSSDEGAVTLRHVDDLFGNRFGDMRRAWACTSPGVRGKLERSAKPCQDPKEALAGLRKDGITHVAVKSLHLASGMEYKELKDVVDDSRESFGQITLSVPLLDAPADLERTIRCLLRSLPAGTGADDALLLVAHGSRRPEAQAAYEAAALCRRFERRVLLGSLMSRPSLNDVTTECKASGIKKLVLAPLMIAAGFSARNEIAGNGPESWLSALSREGIRCVPMIKGLGDHDDIVSIWLDDVERMLIELSGSELQATAQKV